MPQARRKAKTEPRRKRTAAASTKKRAARPSAASKRASTGSTRASAGSTRAGSPGSGGAQDDVLRANLKAFRDAFASSVSSLNLVLVPRDRIQEVLDDAVRRGRVTRDDANDVVSDLVRRGRRQTEDLLKDLEQLAGRGREQFEGATDDARKRASGARKDARRQPGVDRVLREVDRGRRAAGLPPSFPVLGYDELSAAQVSERLEDLTPAQLRKVRDYERRNANRKTVLTAIERALA